MEINLVPEVVLLKGVEKHAKLSSWVALDTCDHQLQTGP